MRIFPAGMPRSPRILLETSGDLMNVLPEHHTISSMLSLKQPVESTTFFVYSRIENIVSETMRALLLTIVVYIHSIIANCKSLITGMVKDIIFQYW